MLARNNWDVNLTIGIVTEKTGKKRRVDIVSYIPDKQTSQNELSTNNKTNVVQPQNGLTKSGETSTVNSQTNKLDAGSAASNTSSASHISPTIPTINNAITNKPVGHGSVKTVEPIKKPGKRRRRESDSNGDSDDETARPKDRVFNSDDEDSDEEQTFHMTKDRREVFNFINKASVTELQAVKSCSSKKIDVILELRPFRDWQHMMQSFQSQKTLSAEVLNHCQDFLGSRNSMVKVMEKCEKICKKLESSVAAGGGLCSQPSILNSNYKLADYQLVGLNWLAVMNQEKTNGILADEMGLGKTIQVIAFLAYLKETGKAKYPHLIVVPSSTLDNWDQEFAK